MTLRRVILSSAIAAIAVIVSGCSAQVPSPPATQQPSSILVGSSPAAGATVKGKVETLELRFNPPARLNELTVSGPEGLMPMKVAAVGEVADYSIPVASLGPGQYRVNWKATSVGHDYQGSFAFVVK